MMYGFGDDQNPYTESVDIIEDLVIEFITEMTHKWVFYILVMFSLTHSLLILLNMIGVIIRA